MNEQTFGAGEAARGSFFYYYKDKVHQDSTVKVSAELSMFDELGTPANLRI